MLYSEEISHLTVNWGKKLADHADHGKSEDLVAIEGEPYYIDCIIYHRLLATAQRGGYKI